MKIISFLISLLQCSSIAFVIDLTLTKLQYYDNFYYDSNYLEQLDYTIPTIAFHIGTPCQMVSLSISTENDYTFILSPNDNNRLDGQNEPTSADMNYFNKTKSVSYESLNKIIYTQYQHHALRGIKSKDVFSFPSVLAFPQKMIFIASSIESQVVYEGFSGYFSIKKTHPNIKVQPEYNEDNIWTTIHKMRNEKAIATSTIAIQVSDQGGKFYIGEQFNEDNYSKCKIDSQDTYWSCHISFFAIGNESKATNTKIYFDSKSHFITIPLIDCLFLYNQIMQLVPGMCRIEEKSLIKIMLCNRTTPIESLPDISIYIDDMKKEHIIIRTKHLFTLGVGENEELFISKLFSKSNLVNEWVMGLPGFKDNLIIFDNENGIISFGSLKKIAKDNKKTNNRTLHIALLILMTLLIIGIIVQCVVHCILLHIK